MGVVKGFETEVEALLGDMPLIVWAASLLMEFLKRGGRLYTGESLC